MSTPWSTATAVSSGTALVLFHKLEQTYRSLLPEDVVESVVPDESPDDEEFERDEDLDDDEEIVEQRFVAPEGVNVPWTWKEDAKLAKYKDHAYIDSAIISAYLDPRWKKHPVVEAKRLKDRNSPYEFKKSFLELFKSFHSKYNQVTEPQERNNQEDDFIADLDQSDELSAWHVQPPISAKADPLQFWHSKRDVMPTLYRIACDYLATPATSVPSECVFSKASSIITKKRARLQASTIQWLVPLAHWFRSGFNEDDKYNDPTPIIVD